MKKSKSMSLTKEEFVKDVGLTKSTKVTPYVKHLPKQLTFSASVKYHN